jgi:hypothetical protein
MAVALVQRSVALTNPTPSGDSMKSNEALTLHLLGLSTSFPPFIARNGPSSVKAPIKAEQGGPPLNHMTRGDDTGSADSASISQ